MSIQFKQKIDAEGGIEGLTLTHGISGSNFNISGVNALYINDPGEGVVFQGTNNVHLLAIDDSTDNKMNFSGASELQVNGNKVALESQLSSYLPLAGGTMTGNITFASQYGVRFNDANTRIYTNTDTPEDLLVEADQDLILTPDGQIRMLTAGSTRLQVQNDTIVVGDDVNMQYDNISTGNSGTVVYGGFLNPASEANMVHVPHVINDLAGFNKWSNATITTSGFYKTRSGSSGSYTYSNEVSSTDGGWANAFDAHSSTAGSWYSDNGSDGVYTHGTDTPGVVELEWTNEATYSLWAGIVFGSGSFTPTYVKIEAYRADAWQTLCEITNNTEQVILRQVGSNSGTNAATRRLKYTLGGSVNGSYFRIHSLYMANYRAGDNNLNNTGTDTTRGVNFLERYKNNYLHGHLYPGKDDTYDLGSSSYQWKNGYFDGNVICDGVNVEGNITVTGTVDGKDVSSLITTSDVGTTIAKGQNNNYIESNLPSTNSTYRNNYGAGVWAYSGYSTGSNRPYTYDATLQVMPTSNLGFELSTSWHSTGEGTLKIRALRDCCEGWGSYFDIWSSANDGAGSGLDADKLDGEEGSYYLDYGNLSNVPSTFAPANHSATTITSGTLSDDRLSAGVFRTRSATVVTDSDWDDFVDQGTYGVASGAGAQFTGDNRPTHTKDGVTFEPDYRYGHLVVTEDNGQGIQQTYYPHSGNQKVFTRTGWSNASWGDWSMNWNTRNMGAGSNLDADKLDGQQGSHYLDYNNFTNTPTIPSADNLGNHTATQDIDIGDNQLINDSATVFYDRTSPEIDYYDYSKLILGDNKVELHSPGEYIFSGDDPYIYFKKPSSGAFLNGNQNVMKVGLISSFGPGLEAVDTTFANLNTDLHFIVQKAGSQYEALKIAGDGSVGTDSQVYIKDNLSVTKRVGIGTTTPQADLHIQDAGSSSSGIRIEAIGSTKTDTVNMHFQGSSGNAPFYISRAATGGAEIQIQHDGDLILNGTNGDNVGVGTTTPQQKLDVNGHLLVRNNIYLNSGTSNSIVGTGGGVEFYTNSINRLDITYTGDTQIHGNLEVDDVLKVHDQIDLYQDGNQSTVHGSIKIDTYGNYSHVTNFTNDVAFSFNNRIFQTSTMQSSYQADLTGGTNSKEVANFYMTDLSGQGNNYACLALKQASAPNSGGNRTSNTAIKFESNNNTIKGTITFGGTGTQYNTTSDYRLKEDFKDFNGLDLVSQMKVYDFKWIDGERDYGVKAHELQDIKEDWATGYKDQVGPTKSEIEEDGDVEGIIPQQVDYSTLVPVLIKAIQELEAKVAVLESNQ